MECHYRMLFRMYRWSAEDAEWKLVWPSRSVCSCIYLVALCWHKLKLSHAESDLIEVLDDDD